MNPSPASPEHRDLVERLGAYVLDGLDATERREVDAHLATCPSCRAELAAIAPLAAPLAGLDPQRLDRERLDPERLAPERLAPERLDVDRLADRTEPVPPGFDDVLRRVRAEGTPDVAEAPATVSPLRPHARPHARLLVAAGVVVLALAGGAVGYGLGVREAQGPRDPVSVQALVPGVEADAATIPHTWGVEVVLTARGFDPGRTYLVAVTDREGRAVGAGAFVGTGDTEMVCRLNSPVLPQEATGFVVTTGQGDEVLRSRFV